MFWSVVKCAHKQSHGYILEKYVPKAATLCVFASNLTGIFLRKLRQSGFQTSVASVPK